MNSTHRSTSLDKGQSVTADSSSELPDPETPPTVDVPEQPAAKASEDNEPAQPVSEMTEDELPEFEELTPELMEDECLRGDVMLRWALVLLAVLLSWTYITESSLLVRIRTGEYMLSHGILPPRVDVFSATAEGRPWVNLSWLSDLILGTAHQFLGMTALTLLCVLTVAAAFCFLSRVNVPGVSTWWGSTCGIFALIALFPIFQPGPATITLLGLAILMFLLSRESQLPANAESALPTQRFPWSFPELTILFLFWANLDSRCWIGLLLLLLFLAGDALSRKLHKVAQSGRDWGVVLVTVLVAALVTPWPGRPALEFVTSLRTRKELLNYSGISEFFPRLTFGFLDPQFWTFLDVYGRASLLLVLISLVCMLLNIRRLNWGWAGVWLGINLLSLIDGDCVCYAAVVNAAIATLNGQDWYRNNFSQSYSIDSFSVFWGRGGRAAVVMSFFLVAYLAINGALMGPQGRRLGLGLDPRWINRIESLQTNVLAHAYSDAIFPTIPSQGDVLIWVGKKPFVDSRLALYLEGKKNLLQVHREVRSSLFSGMNDERDNDVNTWKKTLETYKTFDVLVRLWGPVPPYEPLLRMLSSPDWAMTGFGAAGANFTRMDLPIKGLQEHDEKFLLTNFSERAFRPAKKIHPVELQNIWPAPVSRYDSWLMQKLEVTSDSAQLAAHEDTLSRLLAQGIPLDQVSGLALLAIRNCRQALSENPNHPLAYRVLLHSYSLLQQVEQQLSQSVGLPADPGAYSPQILACAYAAVTAGGESALDLQRLLDVQMAQGQLDVSLNTLNRFNQAISKLPTATVDGKRNEELEKLKEELQKASDEVQAQIQKARSDGAQRAQLIAMAVNGRCPALALSILEEDLTELQQAPELRLIYASLLLKTGDLETALLELTGLEPMLTNPDSPPPPQILSQWREMTAAANIAAQNTERAVELWEQEEQSMLKSAIMSELQMPFASMALPVQYELWPALTARIAASAGIEIPERWGHFQLQAARAELQAGRLEQATKLLQQLLEVNPRFTQRAVVGFYLGQLTNSSVEIVSPQGTVPNGQQPPKQADESANQPENQPETSKPATQEKPEAETATEQKPAEEISESEPEKND